MSFSMSKVVIIHENTNLFKIFMLKVCQFKKLYYLCTRKQAQMAESVDALVSNTSGAIRAGSTPALGTEVKG